MQAQLYRPPSTVTLFDVVGEGRLAEITPQLPEAFFQRPWPQHSLGDRIVDIDYIPILPVTDPEQGWPFELVEDRVISIDGNRRRLAGASLVWLNLKLLTRDYFLRDRQVNALAQATLRWAPDPVALRVAAKRLRVSAAPRQLVEYTKLGSGRGSSAYSGGSRLTPAAHIEDKRLHDRTLVADHSVCCSTCQPRGGCPYYRIPGQGPNLSDAC
jgi:hypothetical protein